MRYDSFSCFTVFSRKHSDEVQSLLPSVLYGWCNQTASAAMDNLTNTSDLAFEFSCLATENLSRTGFSNKTAWRIREELHYGTPVVATVLLIFFLVAFFWNLFIIVTFLVKHQLLKEPGNILLLNLAISDFLYAVITIMFSVVTEIGQSFVFGSNDFVRCDLCNFAGVFFMMLIGVAVFTLAVLSVDRFIHLTKALQYNKIMKIWRVLLIIVIIWVLSLLVSLFPIFGFGQYEFNNNFGACLPRFTGENLDSGINNYFYVVFIVMELLIPVSVLIITSIWTYKFISKFFKKNHRRKTLYRRESGGVSTGENPEDKQHRKQQIQLVKVFGALFISNIVSWTPLVFVAFLVIFISAERVPGEVYIFGYIAYLTSPVVHPIIESFFVKDLRYHVNRAKKFIGRGGTYIIRASTYAFRKKDLDKANARVDSGVETPPRQIRFFKSLRKGSEFSTEVVSLGSMSRDSTPRNTPSPSPQVPPRKTPSKPPHHLRRKVTFSEDEPAESHVGKPSDQQQRNGSLAEVPEEAQVACNGELLTPPEIGGSRVPGAQDGVLVAGEQSKPSVSAETIRYGVGDGEQEQIGEVTIRIDEC